jgi:biopolymer transport protein ExbB
MAGISEALVATAIGLLVAIPAVVGFNYFNRRVKQTLANVDNLAHVVLAQLKGEGDAPATASGAGDAKKAAATKLSEAK